MASHLNKAHTAKTKSKRESELTIMIVGKVGKIRSFKVSPGLLFWASLIMFIYLVISILIINDYLEKSRSNNALSDRLKALQNEVYTSKRELYRSKQRLALLENPAHPPKTGDEKETIPLGAPEKAEREKVEKALEDRPVEEFDNVTQKTLVDVKDLSIREEKSKLMIAFNLINVNEDNDPVNGYVHIIALNNQTPPSQLWSYPKVALKNGFPVNYKRGQPFVIRRFKTIKGKQPLDIESEPPSSIKILVYDQSGNLLLQKEFEVENAT